MFHDKNNLFFIETERDLVAVLLYRISQYFRVHYILANFTSKIHIAKLGIAKMYVCMGIYSTRRKNVLKTVRSVCVAQR